MADGGSILQYQALDDRGDDLLDQVEAQGNLKSDDWRGERIREYFLPQSGSGKEGIEPLLASIEPNWQQHVARITPR
jgi:hypothetical protein